MDLSVSATTYLNLQPYGQQAALRGQEVALSRDQGSFSAERRAARAELSPASAEAQKAREEAARKQDPSTEKPRSPGFSFEYQDRQQVMKVHNGKGVLIYQVPSKGQLALIQAEEAASRDNRQIELTA